MLENASVSCIGYLGLRYVCGDKTNQMSKIRYYVTCNEYPNGYWKVLLFLALGSELCAKT